jgi:hypothetical protein
MGLIETMSLPSPSSLDDKKGYPDIDEKAAV